MRKKQAFTIIELLIVIAIIGILASLVTVALNSLRAKSRDTRRVSDIKQIHTALELYKMDEGSYPSEVNFVFGKPLAGSISGITYLEAIPSNPTPRTDGSCDGSNYNYSLTGGGDSYNLSYCLGSTVGQAGAGVNIANPTTIYAGCSPTCDDKCGGMSDGCGGTCDTACVWEPLGGSYGISSGSIDMHQHSLEMVGDTVYVAVSDGGETDKGRVYYYSGGAWASTVFDTNAVYDPALGYHDGHLYVAYGDGGNSYKPTVRKLNLSTMAWSTVGNAGWSTSATQFFSIAFDSGGTPYVSFTNGVNTSQRLWSKYYDSSTDSWVPTACGNPIQDVLTYESTILLKNDEPHISYLNFNSYHKIVKCQSGGSSWSLFASSNPITTTASYNSMAFDSSDNFVWTFDDDVAHVRAKQYNGSSWNDLGSQPIISEVSLYDNLVVNTVNDNMYYTYRDNVSGQYALSTYKYDGNAWAMHGSGDYSPGQADFSSSGLGSNYLYVAFKDVANGGKLSVMRMGK